MQVVHDHFNYFAVFENIWIDVSVDCWIRYFGLIHSE